MQKNQETHGQDGLSLPNAGVIIEAQRAALENASHMASAACRYAITLNKTWLELWESRLDDYFELPKRFAQSQTDFMEQAIGHYQESMRKLGGLASTLTQEAQTAVHDAQAASERAARQFQQETRDVARAAQPKEVLRGGDERREQPGAH
jgi:uncharacterized protein with von Willebrand factor type A (vWA) domain